MQRNHRAGAGEKALIFFSHLYFIKKKKKNGEDERNKLFGSFSLRKEFFWKVLAALKKPPKKTQQSRLECNTFPGML